jgi:hypothetical protein
MDEARYASAPLSPAESAVRQSPTASDGPYGIDNSTHLPHFEVPACWPFDTTRATQSSAAPMQPFRRGSVAEPVNLCAAHSAAAATLSRAYSAGRVRESPRPGQIVTERAGPGCGLVVWPWSASSRRQHYPSRCWRNAQAGRLCRPRGRTGSTFGADKAQEVPGDARGTGASSGDPDRV